MKSLTTYLVAKSYEALLRQSLESLSEEWGSSSIDDIVELTLRNAIDECVVALCPHHRSRIKEGFSIKEMTLRKMGLYVTPQNFDIELDHFVQIAHVEIELPLLAKLLFIGKTLDSVVSHRYCYVSSSLTLNF